MGIGGYVLSILTQFQSNRLRFYQIGYVMVYGFWTKLVKLRLRCPLLCFYVFWVRYWVSMCFGPVIVFIEQILENRLITQPTTSDHINIKYIRGPHGKPYGDPTLITHKYLPKVYTLNKYRFPIFIYYKETMKILVIHIN